MINMTYPYNLNDLANSTTMVSLARYSSHLVGDVLISTFVFCLMMVLMFRYSNMEFSESLMISSFICFIISAMFSYIGLLNLYIVIVFLSIFVLSGLYVFIANR